MMPSVALPFLPINPTHPAQDVDIALFDDAHSAGLSYGALRKQINQLSPFLQTKSRGLVFCCLPRSVHGVTAYLSAAASGNAVAMIDPTIPHLQTVIDDYQPEWIIAPTDYEFPTYQNCGWSLPELNLWQRKEQSSGELHQDLYLLLLTSGSTGSHKAVRLSYSNITQNTLAIVSSLGLTSTSRALAHLPLSYSFGLSVLHMQLAVGGSCLLSDKGILSRELWQSAKSAEATLFPGVPYHYEMLQRLRLERLDVPTLKTFIQAGGKMNAALTQSLLSGVQTRKGELFIMYGQTEAAPRICCFPLHEFPEKIGTVGRVLEGGKIDIQEDEIIYTGANVMMGYAGNRADLALGDTMQGRLATGDMGRLDTDGFLTITARKHRFAKLFGQRIALDDLEKIASAIAPVLALETDGKIVFVTASPENNVCERVQEAVIAETKLPATWIAVKQITAIPYQPSGKIDYRKLRELL